MNPNNINHILQPPNLIALGHNAVAVKQNDVNTKDVVCFLDTPGNAFYGFARKNGSNLRVRVFLNGVIQNKTTIAGDFVIKLDPLLVNNHIRWDAIPAQNFNGLAHLAVNINLVENELHALRTLRDAVAGIESRLLLRTLPEIEKVRVYIDDDVPDY